MFLEIMHKMLYYEPTNVSLSVDVNITSASKDCIIRHVWYYLDKTFRFQPTVCNGRHDVLMMSNDLESIAILNVYDVVYCFIISEISKTEAENLFKNTDLSEKSGSF